MSYMERETRFGLGSFVNRMAAAGSQDFVESALRSESRTLIRQGILVVTFVPITVALISKLPDIIVSLHAVLR